MRQLRIDIAIVGGAVVAAIAAFVIVIAPPISVVIVLSQKFVRISTCFSWDMLVKFRR